MLTCHDLDTCPDCEMPRRGKGHANETRVSERHVIPTPQGVRKAQKRSRAPVSSTTKKKWLTTEEAKNKRTDHAQAHHRARVIKETSWADENKVLEQKWGKVGYNYAKKQYDTLLARGDLYAKKRSGRPLKYDDSLFVNSIREARQSPRPHRLSARSMSAKLADKAGGPACRRSTWRTRRSLAAWGSA